MYQQHSTSCSWFPSATAYWTLSHPHSSYLWVDFYLWLLASWSLWTSPSTLSVVAGFALASSFSRFTHLGVFSSLALLFESTASWTYCPGSPPLTSSYASGTAAVVVLTTSLGSFSSTGASDVPHLAKASCHVLTRMSSTSTQSTCLAPPASLSRYLPFSSLHSLSSAPFDPTHPISSSPLPMPTSPTLVASCFPVLVLTTSAYP